MPTNILMPALSPTMTEGKIAKWLKAEGDKIKSGDVIAEIETDKATMEVEAADEGILGKIVVPAGTENVAVNAVIAVLFDKGEKPSDIAPVEAPPPAPTNLPTAPITTTPATAQQTPGPAAKSPVTSHGINIPSVGRIFASPLAKRLAAEKGIDLKSIKGTGPHGRIIRADLNGATPGQKIASAVTAPQSTVRNTPASSGPDAKQLADLLGMSYQSIANSGIRKVIANRLSESKQSIPHFYLSVDCRLDHLLAARKQLNDDSGGKYKLSVNDFVIKAAAMALHAYPAANVAWTDDAILQFDHADISVAVSTPNGLITPIIKAAETKSLSIISTEMKVLAARAREGKLKPTEFQGGTFSVSNLGMYGIKDFAAIINPPQACILAVGAGIETPVVENGSIKVATVMTVTLSVDHRAVDGSVGAEYLQIFKRFIENPVAMLV